MKPSEILQQLLEIYSGKAALRRRHEAVARIAGQYDVNNTYQYVIAREDEHLSWLAGAIGDLGGTVPERLAPETLAPVKGGQALLGVFRGDAESNDAFVATWGPRASNISHARHQLMLKLMLGEMQEQARLFRQASTGRVDLLGRRTVGEPTPGFVMPTRWVE